ncbi:MAG: DNA primase [Deltaproteobacteria bacterium]|nr:DNA primase [Deltaproteobacteria bacterium]
MIPKDKIEEVRERASIVDVISDYVPLKKRGANYIGLCPFHSEKTPSFSVNEEKKMFYCFGCNAAGDAITFLMKKEGTDFPEAVRSLAARFGVTITEEKTAPSSGLKDSLYGVNRLSSEYFSSALRSPGGRSARDYLKKRGLAGAEGIETVKRFSVGFAPDKWDGLASCLSKSGVALDLAEKAGVAVKKEKGFYDRFRNRIIFPVMDMKGRVIAFGGRSIDGAEPKYLNSPETLLFKKGETLYGFYQARQAAAKAGSAIVVEGYFDLLALHCHGFTNTVATMGTALTGGHLRALKAQAASIYALFDSDDAGRSAAIRGLTLFLSEDIPCRAVLLKGAKDPDEFLQKFGAGAMREALSSAEPLMEFYLKELRKKMDMDTPEGKGRYLNNAVEYISRVKNAAERGHYIGVAASYLKIREEAVYEALRTPYARYGASRGTVIGADPVKGLNAEEITVLKVIFKHPELYCPSVDEAVSLFKDTGLKEAASSIAGFIREGRALPPSAMMDEIKDEGIRSLVAGMLFKDDGFIEEAGRMLEDCLKKILNRGKLKPETEEMIRMLEVSGRSDVAKRMRERALERGRFRKG